MLQVKKIIPSNDDNYSHIFDFAEEGTVGRAIFEDNVELLQQLLAIHPDEGKDQIFNIVWFSPYNNYFLRNNANRIEVASLFG